MLKEDNERKYRNTFDGSEGNPDERSGPTTMRHTLTVLAMTHFSYVCPFGLHPTPFVRCPASFHPFLLLRTHHTIDYFLAFSNSLVDFVIRK